MEGEFNFHLKFSTDSAAFGVRDSIPDERAGRVPVEPFRMGYAGFDRGRNRTVAGNTGGIEVIDEEYHEFL